MNFEIKTGLNCFENIKMLHSDDEMFTININDDSVSLPLNVAASISSNITKFLTIDCTARSFDVEFVFKNCANIQKIISILSSQSYSSNCFILNKKDSMDFAEFGARIGNEEFIKPFLSFYKKERNAEINPQNLFERLQEKELIALINDTDFDDSEELLYIKKHFSEVCNVPEFVEWCLCESNISKVEEIVRSDELTLSSEDELLSFIIKLNNDFRFTHLFQYVHLEFCTAEKCSEFLDYINSDEFFQSHVFRNSVLTCLSKRLLYCSSSQKSFGSFESRYNSSFFKEITNNSTWYKNKQSRCKDRKISVLNNEIYKKEKKISELENENNLLTKISKPLNLNIEYANGNVLMEASSIYCSDYDVYNLVDGNIEKYYSSDDLVDSNFQVSLRNGNVFVIKSYSVKKQREWSLYPRNWIIEGQCCHDDKWILIDRQTNVYLDDNELHSFNVTCYDPLKAVRFTMKGENSRNDHRLLLNSFDISGTLLN